MSLLSEIQKTRKSLKETLEAFEEAKKEVNKKETNELIEKTKAYLRRSRQQSCHS